MALWLALFASLIGMAICALGRPLMLMTGQSPAVAARAGWFLAVLMFALPPMIASNVLRTFVSTLGRPYFATAITAVAIGVNALGNWLFVFGHLGAPGLTNQLHMVHIGRAVRPLVGAGEGRGAVLFAEGLANSCSGLQRGGELAQQGLAPGPVVQGRLHCGSNGSRTGAPGQVPRDHNEHAVAARLQ